MKKLFIGLLTVTLTLMSALSFAQAAESNLAGAKVYADIDIFAKRAIVELGKIHGHTLVSSKESADFIIEQIDTSKEGLLMDRYSSSYVLKDANDNIIKTINAGDSCLAPKGMICERSLFPEQWKNIAMKKMRRLLDNIN